MKIKTSAQDIWKELENARNFKSGENLYNVVATNERFIIGDQWKGINTQNLAPTTYNFIGQVAKTQVSSVMANQITINRNPDELSMEDERVVSASKVFTQLDKEHWDTCDMDALNEDVLMDAFTTGLGGTFWYWDESIITGNGFLTKGDFKGELIDSIGLYVSNPNEQEIQNQDWIIISTRKTVQQLKELAKSYKVPENEIEMICADETTVYEAYDKAQNEQDSSKYTSNQATLITKMWKENGKVMCCKSTHNVVIKKPYSIELERYPVAIMNWDKRKKFIYGSSPVTHIIANQKVANLQAAIRHLHAQLMGIPKVAINKNMVSGFTNTVGGISFVDAQQGMDVSSAIRFIQPTQMTIDVDKSIDDSINRTRDLMGANQAALGETRPDNFSAILAQQKAAAVPLESVKRRFYKYIKDVALIWLDFYKHKYKLVRRIQIEMDDDQKVTMDFTGTEYADVYLSTKVDVGASTQYSELLQLDTLKTYWDMGIIKDPSIIIESTPNEILPNKQKILDSVKSTLLTPTGENDMDQNIIAFVQSLPEDVQAQLAQLPEDEREAQIMAMMQQQ